GRQRAGARAAAPARVAAVGSPGRRRRDAEAAGPVAAEASRHRGRPGARRRVSRRALITGVGGQDGSLLAELLLEHGYDVIGVVRRSASSYSNLAEVADRIELIQADLNDELALVRALRTFRPHEVYNLASVSFVP